MSTRWSATAATRSRSARRGTPAAFIPTTGREDKELYNRLAELRRDIAAEHNMPVYRVIRTETLHLLATIKPTTIEGASRLKGIGPWTRQNTLRAFVELIQDYEDA